MRVTTERRLVGLALLIGSVVLTLCYAWLLGLV